MQFYIGDENIPIAAPRDDFALGGCLGSASSYSTKVEL